MRQFLLSSFLLLSVACAASADVTTIRLPRKAEVPEVVLDQGILHVVYGHDLGGDAFYVRSADLGSTFSDPVQLNRRAGTVTTGMERGPKLALGKDGTIHVVWLGYYQKGGGVWYTRSVDGGKTFDAERCLTPEVRPAWDNATVTADADGNVFVVWTGQWPGMEPDPKSPVASPIILAHSSDNGRTFAPSELVKHDYPGRACGCCRLNAALGADGAFLIGFRGAYENIRDPWLLKGDKKTNDFHALRISEDNWNFPNCPMSGIPCQVDAKGRVLVSWMSRDRVYWSRSDDAVKRFGPRVAAPGSGKQAAPIAVANGRGEVVLVWKEADEVRWALYGADGAFSGKQGKAGRHPGSNKPTAFVGTNDEFFIVF